MYCDLCLTNIANYKCSKCNVKKYCSKECQLNDWKEHKINCCQNNEFIIDVGSSWNGYNTKEWRNINKYYPIIFIEPDKEAFDKLVINDKDIKLNLAINTYDGEVEFNFYQEGTHSILKTNLLEVNKFIDGYTSKNAKVEDWKARDIKIVKCNRLDTLINKYNIKRIPFLKIDTQGFDLNVIKSLGDKINIVDYLVCEVQITNFELYLNSSKKNDILKYMNDNNFILYKTEKQTLDQEENLYFKNINTNEKLKEISTYYYFNNLNYPINVSKETKEITPHTFLSNGELWENKSMVQFFQSINMNKKNNIVDIGAQSGLYTLFSKYLHNCHFYSFEPFKETFDLLKENVKINNIEDKVTLFNMGMSDQIGKKEINICKSHNGFHTFGNNLLRFNNNDSYKLLVDITTLDNEFYDKNIEINYIKIDTEGWEYYIIKGGLKTINKYKPIIQLEWNLTNMKQCNVKEDDFIKLLNEINYYEKSFVEEEKLFYPKN